MQNNNLNFKDIIEGFKDCSNFVVTEKMIDDYILLTGDSSAIHQCEIKAKKYGFKNRVMHGGLLIGFYSKIIGTKLPGDSGIILELKSKFNNPVYPGDKLSINYEVISKHHSVSCITIKFRSINQTGLTVGTALVSVKIRA